MIEKIIWCYSLLTNNMSERAAEFPGIFLLVDISSIPNFQDDYD